MKFQKATNQAEKIPHPFDTAQGRQIWNEMPHRYAHIKVSVIGGTVSSAWIHITSEDLIKTAVMAAFGAVVSYIVSILIKWTHRRFKKE